MTLKIIRYIGCTWALDNKMDSTLSARPPSFLNYLQSQLKYDDIYIRWTLIHARRW